MTLRSALLIFAAASASSVAPAQVGPTSQEPLIPVTTASLPKIVVPEPITNPTYTPDADTQSDVDGAADSVAPQIVKPTGDLSSLVAQLRGPDAGSRELECLAVGIYFESKSEPLAGQLAVGEVIANRANSNGRFPSTYCGVLFQRGQFSFIRGRSLPTVARSNRQWQTAVAIAKIVDQDLKDSAAENALFFHAKRVSPGWRLKRVASIGNHVFYR
ncbi:cell wall hydrolase [Sphingomonas daechungensis]|uniref:cell wall hydrolase n=1 Tax=Sphingomonas daechungensis TaxID=1176646 RepID=UPI0031EB2AA8